jgi:cysteine-rich repeat protein
MVKEYQLKNVTMGILRMEMVVVQTVPLSTVGIFLWKFFLTTRNCQTPLHDQSLCYKCGNGIVDATENCDDGNANNGDGCSYPTCLQEPYWSCDKVTFYPFILIPKGNPSTCNSLCGDGILNGFETCDPPVPYFCNSNCQSIGAGKVVQFSLGLIIQLLIIFRGPVLGIWGRWDIILFTCCFYRISTKV